MRVHLLALTAVVPALVALPAPARLRFRGSDGPEELATEGNSRVDADGRGGDDVLYGGPRNDRLIGGDGHDLVSGSGGTDVCDAERIRGCEA